MVKDLKTNFFDEFVLIKNVFSRVALLQFIIKTLRSAESLTNLVINKIMPKDVKVTVDFFTRMHAEIQ